MSKYDTATDTWDHTWPQLTEGRRGHSCARLGSILVVAGGFSFTTFEYTASTLTINAATGISILQLYTMYSENTILVRKEYTVLAEWCYTINKSSQNLQLQNIFHMHIMLGPQSQNLSDQQINLDETGSMHKPGDYGIRGSFVHFWSFVQMQTR